MLSFASNLGIREKPGQFPAFESMPPCLTVKGHPVYLVGTSVSRRPLTDAGAS